MREDMDSLRALAHDLTRGCTDWDRTTPIPDQGEPISITTCGELRKASAAILALLDDNERLRKALDRQCDNMAFVINHVDIHRWAEKFLRELEEDREVLTARLAHEDADARP